MATAGGLMKRVLGGAGKGAAKIANAVDDAGAVIKNAAMNATDVVSDAYRTTRMQSAKVIDEMEEGIRDATGKKIKKPKIKEARVSGNESNNVVDEAINQQRISEPVTSYDYRQRIVNGKEVFEKRPTGAGDSAWASIDDVTEYRDARRNSHSNTAEFTYSSAETTGNLPAVIAQENCESGAGWWDGIPGWAKLGGAAVAGGIAGAFLADDD